MSKISAKVPTRFGAVEIHGEADAVREFLASLSPAGGSRGVISRELKRLLESGWFDTPRTLGETCEKLRTDGFNYPSTSVFPSLQRNFLRTGILQRSGRPGKYTYQKAGALVTQESSR
jgi:hypothetical protein